jgi:hypothetical protein
MIFAYDQTTSWVLFHGTYQQLLDKETLYEKQASVTGRRWNPSERRNEELRENGEQD